MKKSLAVMLSLAMVGGALLATPAEAKKKKKKKKKPPACAPYVPGEQGAEAETLVVTATNSEEAPLEATIAQGPGTGSEETGMSHAFLNVQVDAAAADAGLYVRYEFPEYEDHDLYVYYSDGSEAATVGGFNQVSAGPLDGTGSGGHSEQGAEQLDGLRTADCAGYTLDLVNFLGQGGDYTVKFWLGEVQNEPA